MGLTSRVEEVWSPQSTPMQERLVSSVLTMPVSHAFRHAQLLNSFLITMDEQWASGLTAMLVGCSALLDLPRSARSQANKETQDITH
eukprot:1160664-Pelagomonas_calceolata.AAC.2